MKNTVNNILIKYIFYCFLVILTKGFMKDVFNLDKQMYDSLGDKIAYCEMFDWLRFNENWHLNGYLLVPIYLGIKLIIITANLYVGICLFNNEIQFKELFNCILNAEFIFLLVPLFKGIWFYFFQTGHNFADFQYFYPLSGLNVLDYKNLKISFIYPLQLINLFESSYVLFLGFQIGNLTETTFNKGLIIVSSSYLPVLLFWIVFVFLRLNSIQ